MPAEGPSVSVFMRLHDLAARWGWEGGGGGVEGVDFTAGGQNGQGGCVGMEGGGYIYRDRVGFSVGGMGGFANGWMSGWEFDSVEEGR